MKVVQELKPGEQAPDNANTGCVGPTSEEAGKASACAGCPNQSACSSGAMNSPEALAKQELETQSLRESLANVSNTILVLSGKGGVGKSTIAAQLCHTLASQGYAVGLLDVDLCGPSAPRMLLGKAATLQSIHKSGSGAWTPIYAQGNLAVMSISFMLQNPNQAVVWRGPRKNALIQQFLTEVDWTGDTEGLDYLIIDTPPGTSDEHISTVQYLQRAQAISGAVVVTTPEEISLADVRKELNFCQKTNVPVIGVIENMSSYQTTIEKLCFLNKTDGKDCTADILAKLREKCPEVLDCIISSDLFAGSARAIIDKSSTTSIEEKKEGGCCGGGGCGGGGGGGCSGGGGGCSGGGCAGKKAGGGGCCKKKKNGGTEAHAHDHEHASSTLMGAEGMAHDYNVPYWGQLPMDPDLLKACEDGLAFVKTHPESLAAKKLIDFCSIITTKLPVNMA